MIYDLLRFVCIKVSGKHIHHWLPFKDECSPEYENMQLA